MLQNTNTTLRKLQERKVEGNDVEPYVQRLDETVREYGVEVVRDLKENDWRCQFNGGLSAGYLLCIIGEFDKGIGFLERSLQIHQANKDQYSQSESSALEFVVGTLEEFGANPQTIEQYRSRLAEAKTREEEKPEDLRRKIVHLEADLECATGDLDQIYSHGRREQGLLYQKLGEHKKAIEYFKIAIKEDKRDFRGDATIPNRLSIVDSYVALGDRDSAVSEFMVLMKALIPNEINEGDEIPDLFRSNFEKFYPYFEKLGIVENLETITRYSRARIEKLKGMIKTPSPKEDPKEHWKRSELAKLTEIVGLYNVGRGEYQQASDVFDEGREFLEYKHHLSRREQAEFAIRAGNPAKALELIKEDEKDEHSGSSAFDNKDDELENLYLQLGDFDSAFGVLEKQANRFKGSLVSGSFDHLYQIRREQIGILKAAIGDDYVQRLREHARGRAVLLPEDDLKFIPLEKVKKEKKLSL